MKILINCYQNDILCGCDLQGDFASALCIVDQDYNLLLFNRKYLQLWNFSREELEQNPAWEYRAARCIAVHRDVNAQHALVEKFETDQTRSLHDEATLVDGTILERCCIPFIGSDGLCRGRLWKFTVITERVKRKQEIEEGSGTCMSQKPIISAINPDERELCFKTLSEIMKAVPGDEIDLESRLESTECMRHRIIANSAVYEVDRGVNDEAAVIGGFVDITEGDQGKYGLYSCPIETTMKYLGNKWEFLIRCDLLTGTKRFKDLRESLGVSPKALAQHLRTMQEKKIIHREAYAEIPPRVEYSLTELGLSLEPIHDAVQSWNEEHKGTTALLCMVDKRSSLIVRDLLTGTKRFGDLKSSQDIPPKALAQHLRTLQEKKVIHREAYAEVPPRVEYSLTELGHSLKPIHDVMRRWSEENETQLENSKKNR